MAAGLCCLTGAFAGLSWLWILPLGFLGSLLGLVVLAFLFLWLCCAVVVAGTIMLWVRGDDYKVALTVARSNKFFANPIVSL